MKSDDSKPQVVILGRFLSETHRMFLAQIILNCFESIADTMT